MNQPRARFLVVGSIPADDDHRRNFEAACQQIGQAIADQGFSLTIGSDRENTADHHIMAGAKQSTEKAVVEVCYHDGKDIPYERDQLELLNALDISWSKVPGTWATGRVPQIQTADIVLIIGGSDKSAQVAHLAKHLGKPYLPIPAFGGAAEEMWPLFEESCSKKKTNAAKFLSSTEPWNPNRSAKCVVDFAVTVVKNHPRLRPHPINFVPLMLIMLGGVALWQYLFFGAPATSSLFYLPAAASIIGSGIRALTDYVRQSRLFNWTYLGVSAVIGIMFAFVTSLLTFLGIFSVEGDLAFIEKLSEETNFQRVALVLSLLALSGGYLTEVADEILRVRIEKFARQGVE